MKPYLLYYWGFNKDNATNTTLIKKNVLVSDDTIKGLTGDKKLSYVNFLVDDGQKMIISTNCVHSLVSQFTKEESN